MMGLCDWSNRAGHRCTGSVKPAHIGVGQFFLHHLLGLARKCRVAMMSAGKLSKPRATHGALCKST